MAEPQPCPRHPSKGHLMVSTWPGSTGMRTGIFPRSFPAAEWLQDPKLPLPSGLRCDKKLPCPPPVLSRSPARPCPVLTAPSRPGAGLAGSGAPAQGQSFRSPPESRARPSLSRTRRTHHGRPQLHRLPMSSFPHGAGAFSGQAELVFPGSCSAPAAPRECQAVSGFCAALAPCAIYRGCPGAAAPPAPGGDRARSRRAPGRHPEAKTLLCHS